jgi:hypothetical protein
MRYEMLPVVPDGLTDINIAVMVSFAAVASTIALYVLLRTRLGAKVRPDSLTRDETADNGN